jgi:hypothetical protein
MRAQLSDRELRLLRLRGQRLLPGSEAGSVAEAAASALTIQAQDAPAATLALRARTSGITAEGVRATAGEGTVFRAWLMRNTIHLFAAADLAWMRPLLAERPLRPAMLRFGQMGMDEAGVEKLLDLLRERLARGPLPRAEARELVIGAGLKPGDSNQRIYWLLHVAALRGVLAVSPALDQKQVFVEPPPDEPLEREEGYARLARRFLEAYGPASPRDLAYWGKVTLADARLGWESAGELVEVITERGPMWALPGRLDPPCPDQPIIRLLPIWENYLLGYEDRDPAMPPAHARFPGAGRASATADGYAFGHWRVERARDSIAVVIEPFGRLPKGARPGLEAEAADIGRFLEAEATLRFERLA